MELRVTKEPQMGRKGRRHGWGSALSPGGNGIARSCQVKS